MQSLTRCTVGSVNDHVLAVPNIVSAGQNLSPRRKLKTGNVTATLLDPAAMLHQIRTCDFDLDPDSTAALRNLAPCVSRKL